MASQVEQELEKHFSALADKLTSITGFSELLLFGVYGTLTPEQEQVMRTIVTVAKETCDLIRLDRRH